MNQYSSPSSRNVPAVIKNLLIINVLVLLAQNTIGTSGLINMEQLFGLHHVMSPLFRPWQIITHLFLHGGFLHLVYNMFALWIFGSELEELWGPKRFLTFYILCGIGAALIQLLWLWFQSHDMLTQFAEIKLHPGRENISAFFNEFGLGRFQGAESALQNYLSDPGNPNAAHEIMQYISSFSYATISEPTIGASGAVFGILAAYIYLFPNRQLYLYLVIGIKAKWVGLLYFGYEIVSAFQNNPTDNIAHWAHIGGGLVGFLLVLSWNMTNRKKFY